MNFCIRCGANTVYKIPENDNHHRYVCRSCGYIHYENPKIVAGCLVRSDDKVLLCKRGIEPRRGYWTLPAGFLEIGESTRAGAERETWEEACAKVTIHSLYTQFDVVYLSQIYMFFLADLDGSFDAGEETLATQLYSRDQIPWEDLSFPVVHLTLNYFFNDHLNDEFPHHHEIIQDRLHWMELLDKTASEA